MAALCTQQAFADEAPKVVTTIKPVHSLAASIMQGVGEPELLINGAASPHGFSLKPSQAADIQSADLVFWIGPELTPSLQKPLQTLGEGADVVALIKAPGVKQLPFREDANFETHDHDDDHGDDHGHGDDHADEHEKHASAEEHDHDDDHGHGDDHAHAHEEASAQADDDHGHGEDQAHDTHASAPDHSDHAHDDDEHDHAHAEGGPHDHVTHGIDAHIWLDPENGRAMARDIAHHLSEIDPDHAQVYAANLAALDAELASVNGKVAETLRPVRGKPFVVFHDAYQYFEKRYDFPAAGSITLSPEVSPGADRISEIRHKIEDLDVRCVFAEPQFEPKLVRVVIEGTNAHMATLDPLGSRLTAGPGLYAELIEGTATTIADCLSESVH
ncbi:zinc ABC transporter substrate-binding protein [Roseibium sp. RKSG952]|nr:zinc ABC transporter substrate-binding protein [Roseibium sp. RKSG952]